VAAGRARRVLAIGAEVLSRFIDLEGPHLLHPLRRRGRRGGARRRTRGRRGRDPRDPLGADGSGFEFIHMVAGGSRGPRPRDHRSAREHWIRVHGREIFRFAVARMSSMIEDFVARYGAEESG
jgi:3-oxoacyl-[acyl-carrier-protein] synthase-3